MSVGTVSRALDGGPDVAPGPRARILRLATELEPTPVAVARTLATRRSPVAGVFLRHPFFHEVVDRPGFDGARRRDRELVQRQR